MFPCNKCGKDTLPPFVNGEADLNNMCDCSPTKGVVNIWNMQVTPDLTPLQAHTLVEQSFGKYITTTMEELKEQGLV